MVERVNPRASSTQGSIRQELVASVGDSRYAGRASGTTPTASIPRFGIILGRSARPSWSIDHYTVLRHRRLPGDRVHVGARAFLHG